MTTAPLRRGTTPDDARNPQNSNVENVEYVARVLLRRYGVICWRLLAREAAWLPPWRELLRVYQRMEARGEVRGGRFIAGLYVGLPGRDAEYDGWLFQRNALATGGATPPGLVLNFLNSSDRSSVLRSR